MHLLAALFALIGLCLGRIIPSRIESKATVRMIELSIYNDRLQSQALRLDRMLALLLLHAPRSS